MPELRWTLLILGVLFIAALAWWELRRPRQSVHGSQDRLAPSLDPSDEPAHSPHVHREPTLTLPEIRTREPPQEIPVVEVAEDALIELRADGERPARPPAAEESAAVPLMAAAPQEPEDADRTAQLSVEVPQLAPPPPTAPIVEWPPEDVRRILALRLVAGPERLPGRSLRQALAAEGFLFGRFSIFHKPGPQARAVVSAASLSKPGTFTPEAMDSQRFAGLNLFAILPGPLGPPEAFEELLATARSLNDRLQGGLQDEVGKPLTPSRIASIREELAAAAVPAPPTVAPAPEESPPP